MKKSVLCLLLIAAYTVLVAVVGSYFVNLSSPEYADLVLPSFNPPPIVFIIAWTLIYIFTAIAAYISCDIGEVRLLYVYALNGALNALWPYVFFYKANITLALFVIFALAATIIYLIIKSGDVRSKVLLLPYLFWLCVATVLNYSIIILN